MALNLTQKERMLLEDQKKHEQVCIEKYNNYAQQVQDPRLKQLFQNYAGQEQQHYNTINQMLNGQVPNMSGQQGQTMVGMQGNQGLQPGGQQPQGGSSLQGAMASQSDSVILNDALMTEKYVSSAYNTAIFEFRDANVRQALNHIQKEEQQHGEGIFNYMQANGMYNVQ